MHEFISKYIKENKHSIFIATTGAGAGVQNELWKIPGIGNILAGCAFPYSRAAQQDFLGFSAEDYCEGYTTEKAATALAMQAYYCAFKDPSKLTIGIGATGVVTSLTPHKGEHRLYVAVFTDKGSSVQKYTLDKSIGTRITDGEKCDFKILKSLCYYLENPPADYHQSTNDLMLTLPYFSATGQRGVLPEGRFCLFPGSFNPPHAGHFNIEQVVEKDFSYSGKVVFGVDINPPHKTALTPSNVMQRAKLLKGHHFLSLKDCPLYLDKSRRFPGVDIIVGGDAFHRMMDPQWGPEIDPMCGEFLKNDTDFIVFDRLLNGKDYTLENCPVQNKFTERNCVRMENDINMSSTEIRNANKY